MQPHTPPYSFKAPNRDTSASSRGSATNRYAFASAAGPRKFESTSSTVQSETQAPHMMQSITPARCNMSSLGAMYSPLGSAPSG